LKIPGPRPPAPAPAGAKKRAPADPYSIPWLNLFGRIGEERHEEVTYRFVHSVNPKIRPVLKGLESQYSIQQLMQISCGALECLETSETTELKDDKIVVHLAEQLNDLHIPSHSKQPSYQNRNFLPSKPATNGRPCEQAVAAKRYLDEIKSATAKPIARFLSQISVSRIASWSK